MKKRRILNEARKIGDVGVLLIGLIAYFAQRVLAYGTSLPVAWPDSGFQIYYWDILQIGLSGQIYIVAGTLIALALLFSVPVYTKPTSQALIGLAAIMSFISVYLTTQWLFPIANALANYQNEVLIPPPRLLQTEMILVQATTVMLACLIVAGIAGIIQKDTDNVVNTGYIVALVGGLIPLILGLVTGGLFVTTYGDIEWVIIAHIIGFFGYIGLAAAFSRPVTPQGHASDVSEQETDSQK
ncbi:MAG: hypothetical protein GF309_16240 [Candidatus Lokiarchaeota archaeon]|nr:hypothetical protein [Candidatus Lokiarchaeota archaeon]